MYKWNDERSPAPASRIYHNRITQQRGNARKSTTSPMTPYAWMKPTTTACRTCRPIWKCTMRITRPSTICRTASWQKENKRTAAPPTSCKRCAPPSLRQNFFSLIRNGEKQHGSSILPHSMPIYPPPPCHYDGKDKFIQHSLYNDNKASHLRKMTTVSPGNTPPV